MQPGGKTRRLAHRSRQRRTQRRLLDTDKQPVGHLHMRRDAARQFPRRSRGVKTPLRASDRSKSRRRRLINYRPHRQGHQRESHGLTEIPPPRLIITSCITEPEQVNRYPELT